MLCVYGFHSTEDGGREPEHLSFSDIKPNGDLGKEGIPF